MLAGLDSAECEDTTVNVTTEDLQNYCKELVAAAPTKAERQDALRLVAVLVREGIHQGGMGLAYSRE